MKDFNLSIPTRIYYGREIFKDSLYKEKELLNCNVLVVTTGYALDKLGYVKQLTEVLKDITKETFVFYDIDANPKVEQVENAVKYGVEHDCKVVIGFGGGSSMDAAKAAAVGIGCKKPLNDFMFNGEVPSELTLPIIAIPTTAGTGSELSRGAILTSIERKIKTGIRGEHICPSVAIVDSYFTEQIPEKITIDTGFDVFAHAIESYVSRKSTAFSEMLSLEAIKTVVCNLPILKTDLHNQEARKNMSYASMIMGINLANVGTALPHRMQYPIGARTDTSHGIGLFALYPVWLKYEYKYNAKKIDVIAKLISEYQGLHSTSSVECITKFLFLLQNKTTLADLGVKDGYISEMISDVSGNITADPASDEVDIIRKIYCESL